MKYELNVALVSDNLKLAGLKAVSDCDVIFSQRNYSRSPLKFNKGKYIRLVSIIQLIFNTIFWIASIKPFSIIVVQYPIIGINRIFKLFIPLLKFKNCVISCIIHDINSLRYNQNQNKVNVEINRLNGYDKIITHNLSMTTWLEQKGLYKTTFPLKVFDYLFTSGNVIDRQMLFDGDNISVTYAGNLKRGSFINYLFRIDTIKFELFGPCNDLSKIESQKNVVYRGITDSEKLIQVLPGTFGLIWDGDDINECAGLFGEYIKYNNPHKLSLYIAACLPVIVPETSAIKHFVIEHKIGFTIKSLLDIKKELNKIDSKTYNEMINAIKLLSDKVQTGFFFSSALDWIEEDLIERQ